MVAMLRHTNFSLRFAAYAFAALLLLVPCTAVAQTADSLASVQSELYPSAADGNDPRRRISFHVLRVNAVVPVPIAEKTILLPGLKYEHTNVMIDDAPETPAPVLRTASLSMGVAQGIGEHWTVIGTVGAGVASDFAQTLSRRDLVFTGAALMLYKIGPALSVGGGIAYDQRTGAPLPLPALLVNWRPLENFRVRGFVPARVDAEYRIARWFTAGVFAMFNGDRYALSEKVYGRPNLQIAFSTAELGPKITFSAGDWVHVDLSTTVPVYRRYDLYEDGNKRDGASLAMVPAYGVKFRLGPSLWDPADAR